MNIDLTFAQNYTLDSDVWLPSSPGSTPLYYYPGASRSGGQDGLLLEIAPDDGMAWLGLFAGGSQGFLSGAYGCPDGHSICVVSRGRCYFVKMADPLQWREKTESILFARVLPDHRMLLLCSQRALIAYGTHGFLWKSEPISYHGMTIEAIDGNVLHGKVPTSNRQEKTWVDYEVDLVTGKPKGGVKTYGLD